MAVRNSKYIDRFFLISISVLTLAGFMIFFSASLGLLAQNGVSFTTVAMKQAVSLAGGIILFYVISKIDYVWFRRLALPIFIGALVINCLLFIPSLALNHGGAARWINLGALSFQPSEFLKIAFIVYLAAWIYFVKDKIKTVRFGLVPYIVLMLILGFLLLAQSDTDTLVIIAATGVIMLFVAGIPWKHILIAGALIGVVVGCVLFFRPYALQRVKTFLNRSADTQGAGYQINQSLIAIGSGQILGRGIGQSIQKFGYLPQPTDDSIFAVSAEEFGFVGSVVLIAIYLLVAISMFRIGMKAPDPFGASMAVGIAILIITESFLNMGAMLGLVPLSGVPLLFVSHGGTALIIILAATGIVANISKHTKY